MIEPAALTWLVNALWLVPLIAATTALCTGLGRMGPRVRHGVWFAALALAVSLPALPADLLPFRLAPGTQSPSVSPPVDARALPGVIGRPVTAPAPTDDPLPPLEFDQAWSKGILSLAGVVVAISLCRLLVAIRAGRGLIRAARPCYVDPALQRIVSRVAGQNRRLPPPILESQALASPVVVGAVSPAILIPPGFADLPWDEQRAALLHEMAHVTRRDYAWNLVCEIVSLPLAWHPAILSIKAGVRRSREAACDAMAAEAMASRVAYAKCLVSLVGRLGVSQPTSPIVVGLIGKSDLEERLMTLLDPRPTRMSAVLRAAAAGAIAVAVMAPAVFLRVTPAFADEPVVARRILVTASVAPVKAASTASVAAKPARKPVVAAVQRVASLDSEAPLPPLPPPPPSTFFPAAPPAPPAPLVPSLDDLEIHAHLPHGRYDEIVRRALDRALGVEKVKETDEMRRALAELRTHRLAMVRAGEARIHAEVAAAMAEFDRARAENTLDQFRSRLRSAEFRAALAAAEHESAKAAEEARAGDGKN